ncbi:MAG: 3-dehydroquinate synthase [Caldilineales bacterium]|nr:3-dehydroquinate synthase [Caldilineales bacterium]
MSPPPLPADSNIVLTGFMGTGKTAVGRAVAERLGRWFVDMDAVIEQRARKPIRAIFAEQGEMAFRLMEAELCHELARERNLVIATGGGALVAEANREALGRSGVLICLDAPVEVILERLAGADDRPLLAGQDRRARVEALLAQRAAAYAAIPHHVDTAGKTVEEVAEAVIRIARRAGPGPLRIPVRHPNGEYPILIAAGLLVETGQAMLDAGLRPGPCAVVTNPGVAAAHAGRLVQGLEEVGFRPAVVEFPAGEAHKTLATVATLYDAFVAAGLDRRSPVIALGGGVVGDVAGFAAATFLRGVPFVQAPTSLLAMVDASVGGKTGVDLPQGKNLVGAFKQPELVVIDPETLRTLPSDEFRSGLAEVVKHAIIGDPAMFAWMEGRQLDGAEPLRWGLTEMIAAAVRVKVAVVEEDPLEQGRRAVLNLGHTFGHALEALSNYQMRHGEAVAVGLAAATRLAARLHVCEAELVDRVERLLERLGLPTRIAAGYAPEQVLAAMATDKKRLSGRLRFVLPRAIGDVDIFDDVPVEAVLGVLGELSGQDQRP